MEIWSAIDSLHYTRFHFFIVATRLHYDYLKTKVKDLSFSGPACSILVPNNFVMFILAFVLSTLMTNFTAIVLLEPTLDPLLASLD